MVTGRDGDNGAVTQTYTVNVTGADDAPTLAAVTSGSFTVKHKAASAMAKGLECRWVGFRADAGETLTYGIDGSGVVDNPDGTVSKTGAYGTLTRSEERRVGKEGRSRWSPYH